MKKRILVTSPNLRTTSLFFLQNQTFNSLTNDYDVYVCCDTGEKCGSDLGLFGNMDFGKDIYGYKNVSGSDLGLFGNMDFKGVYGYIPSVKRKRIGVFQLCANSIGCRKVSGSANTVYNMLGKGYGNIIERIIHRLLGMTRTTARIANFLFEKYAGLDPKFKKIVEEVKPDLIITFLTGGGPLEVEAIKSGKFYKIPVLELQYIWDAISIRGMMPYNPDYLGVWGYQSAMFAETIHRIPKERIFYLGTVFTDEFKKPPEESEAEIRKEFGLPMDKKVILFAGNIWAYNEVRNLKILEEAIDEGILKDYCIIYRPHPLQKKPKNDLNFLKQNFKHIYLDPSLSKQYIAALEKDSCIASTGASKTWIGINYKYLKKIFSVCKIAVSGHSSLIIDGSVYGIPTVDIVYTDKVNMRFLKWFEVEHLSILRSMPGVFTCRKPDELIQTCLKAIKFSENKQNITIMKRRSSPVVHDDGLGLNLRLKTAIDTIMKLEKDFVYDFLNAPDYKTSRQILHKASAKI